MRVQILLLAGIGLLIAAAVYVQHGIRAEIAQLGQQVATLESGPQPTPSTFVAPTSSQKRGAARFRPRHRARRRPLESKHVVVTTADLDYVFSPHVLRITAGSRVTWLNSTAEEHSVTSYRARQFSRLLPAYGKVSLVFRKVGTYPYYCRFHPYQHGVIVVIPR